MIIQSHSYLLQGSMPLLLTKYFCKWILDIHLNFILKRFPVRQKGHVSVKCIPFNHTSIIRISRKSIMITFRDLKKNTISAPGGNISDIQQSII